MEQEYTASNIQVLEGLEAVRIRPGMYIGGTGVKGLHHILWEIVDNGIDEVANGFGNSVEIVIYEDNSISVRDNGRGIPVDIHPGLKKSGVEVVFTELHAGAKFGNDNYNFSGGLHGVGASVTNALSKWLNVKVYKNNKVYAQQFHSYEDNGKMKSGVAKTTLQQIDEPFTQSGTFVHFMPDEAVFGKEKINYETVVKRIRELAFLNRGINLSVRDKRHSEENKEDRFSEFCYEGGLSDFARYINESKDTLFDTPIHLTKKDEKFQIDFAIQYTTAYTENLFSYVNNIPTTEGGTHETGFKSAYTKVMNEALRKNNLIKEKDANLLGEDFREGITAVLSIKMQNVQFEGQTKTKLGNPEIRVKVETIVSELLSEYIESLKDNTVLLLILKKALDAAKVREAARKAKELTRQKNTLTGSALVGKLASCTGKKAERNEIFIVEGDSAGGSAKQGRDRSFQAILPLRGKPLNAEKKRIDQILLNEEIKLIITALGTGFDEDFDIDNLKYDKVIILADADQDGMHIRSILLTFFFRYMKELITEGHVYIGMPPLYKVERKDMIRYAYDDSELDDTIKEVGRGYKIQRYKGLGEMNPEQLWATTMNPETRALMRVTIEDAADADKIISTLMGDEAELRRNYIYEYANFNKTDRFEKIGG